MDKVLALTKDGMMTWCTAPEELRGVGRCNHILHQKPGQTTEEFINSVSDKILIEDSSIPDQREKILSLISEYSYAGNPNWENVISDIKNPFNIGKDSDGSYEEANLISFEENYLEDASGDCFNLVATYEFRGCKYKCDFGKVPIVAEDGTITMDNVQWRVLPVLSQYKAGVISYNDKIIVKQKDERNIAFSMDKDPDCNEIKIYGEMVSIDAVEDYFKTGNTQNLTTGQVYALKDIDPISFERFPNFRDDIRSLKEIPTDQCGDLTDRRCFRYEDIVKQQMSLQMRRMGVTFRTNLAKNQEAIANGDSFEEANAKFPLFYQQNLTENIKSDLIGRSNVQNADNLNPISALSQSQKISFTGPGGYNKDKAPYNLRMPHRSHEGIIDSMDVSAGKNVGLTGTLSYGIINNERFIEKKESDSLGPSDFIPYREHNDPNRATMAIAHMKQACPIIGGEDPIVTNKAWDKIKGTKLGVNLRIAYIPEADVFEDSVIISQSAADKMTTIQSQKYECSDTSKLAIGQRVERKQNFGGREIKVGGIVSNINNDGFEIETVYKMTPGDKLAGRHGNKSVVSKILPDNEMPKILQEDGSYSSAQIIMSPLSVIGRKNLGQIKETNEAFGEGPVINKKHNIAYKGKKIEATAGIQYIMRLNHIAEKKLSSHADEMTIKREPEGSRLGEMESILLSTDKDRLEILKYLRHQEHYDSHNKLNSLLKSVGVEMTGINWNNK